ncbi:major facilitator superfamily domain-containing protein [Mycena alexandri]|uniref:Major facilitator superfamily domain-containing protein n=1 Tax=Mycena alexandri TaxID=1745969 RepID=A0AAD6WYI3_9AGAR|nr:major facilitator superfamily domain-containing protein [Mycena alexandri]
MSAPVTVESTEDDRTQGSLEYKSEKVAAKTEDETADIILPDVWSAEYPDGGVSAWLVVFGGVCTTFSTFGYVNAWGVFQAYYEETLLKDSSASNIAWIGSVQYSMIFVPALVSGHFFDRGHFKIPFFIASVLIVAATFLVAQCTQYWHFLLCQGFATGLGSGILFGPINAVMGHWFKKKRGLATGFLATGSSIGGTVFPIVARNLIPRVGFPWTMRIFGFILLCSLGVANLTVRRRLPPKETGGLFNPIAFRNHAYTVYCLGGIVAFLGLYTLLTYIDISATSVGISSDFAFYLISIANAASLFGRLVAGVTTDKFGAVNVISPMTAVAAIMTYVWPLARSKGSFVAIALIYGFSSGVYVSSFILPMYHLGDIEDMGRRSGMAMTLTAFGAVAGPPISGAINTATGGYTAVGYYAGSMILFAIVLMLISRHLVLRQLWGKF